MKQDVAASDLHLRLTRRKRIAEDIHEFEFRHPSGQNLPAFTCGAHIQLHTPNGLVRKYSLCNDPSEQDRYVIAVKRETGGRGGSISLTDDARAGETFLISPPVNDFVLAPNAQHFLFIAGGIGITPILSMIRHLNKIGGKQFRLYYLTRTSETTAYLEELSEPGLADSVTIHHDQGDPARAFDLAQVVAERKNRAHLYCCGPSSLMRAVREMTGHWSPTAVHFEAFSEPEKIRPGDEPFTVTLQQSGETIDVPVGTTILEAMRAKGHDVPSSCETGTCGTCRTKLLSGEADHRDLVLAEHERKNQIMICVSRARSPGIVIDR